MSAAAKDIAAAGVRAGVWLRKVLAPGAQLRLDSREVEAGDAFIAVAGTHADGRDYIAQAIERGAAAIVFDAEPLADGARAAATVTAAQIPVPNVGIVGLRQAIGHVGAEFYGHPGKRLRVVAVTGTNGKTSCAHWIAHGLAEPGGRGAGLIGTLGSGILAAGDGAELESFGLTTPDAISLQRMLLRFAQAKVATVTMEASSIGLEQGRLSGVPVEVALFTNLTRDHLDYHGDMASYLAAKRILFATPGLRVAIVTGEDPAAAAMLEAAPRDALRIAYGLSPAAEIGGYPVRRLAVARIRDASGATEVAVRGEFGAADIRLELLGRFNVVNALGVAAAWIGLGMPFAEAMQRLESLRPVPGRMQRLELPDAPMAVIDYAHTPDALTNVLEALRPVASARGGRLWCVFGAGGDRDPGKRPLMGFAAEQVADRLVITTDNPRSEEPFRIVSDIRAGLSREPVMTELDRGAAIRGALDAASPADVVLIAGKGHENYQEIGGERLPFDDFEVARGHLLARLGAAHV